MTVHIKTSLFEEVLPYWRDFLWPERESPIRAQSSMRFDGEHDMRIYGNEVVFFKAVANGRIVGVNSVFKTGEHEFRSRGLYVAPEWRGQGVARSLLSQASDVAKEKGATRIWSLPRVSALPAYEAAGFRFVRNAENTQVEFGPNVYVIKDLL